MKTGQKGFSLLEVVIATVIIAVLALGLFPTTSLAKKNQLGARTKLAAAALLEKELNQLRVTGAKNLLAGTTRRNTTLTQDGIVGTLITEITAGDNPEDKFVRVNLSWDGGQRNESLADFMFQE